MPEPMTSEYARFYLKACSDEIRDLKRYQWEAVRLCVLIQGGLLALSRFPEIAPPLAFRALLAIVCVLTIPAWFKLNSALESSLQVHRAAAVKIETSSGTADLFKTPDRDSLRCVLHGIVVISAALIALAILIR